MKQITTRKRSRSSRKKPPIEPKNEEKLVNSDKVFVNLIADIVFENLLNKYRK